jgi:hypothetical protein
MSRVCDKMIGEESSFWMSYSKCSVEDYSPKVPLRYLHGGGFWLEVTPYRHAGRLLIRSPSASGIRDKDLVCLAMSKWSSFIDLWTCAWPRTAAKAPFVIDHLPINISFFRVSV